MEGKQMLAVGVGAFGLYNVFNPAWMIGMIAKVPLVGGVISSVVTAVPPLGAAIVAVVFSIVVATVLGVKPKNPIS